MHGYRTSHDQIAVGVGPHRAGRRPRGPARLLLEVLPQGLHSAPALRPDGPPRVPPDRLSWPGGDAPRLGRPTRRPGPDQGPRPFHHAEGGRAAAGKRGVDALLGQTVANARDRGLIPAKPRAAIDATGFEARHVSRYFA